MADEFIKGFTILTVSMLGWMVIAGWYNTRSFGEKQFAMQAPENLQPIGELALTLKTGLLWFAFLGALVFWVIIPATRELRKARASE
jgi:hypothetical protein